METTLQSLDTTRSELAEKDRLLRSRDTLLESTGLEVRRITELLEKERQARRSDRMHFDQIQRGQQSTTRLIQSHDKHVQELEQARTSDRKKHIHSEQRLSEQLAERNNLLLALWNRLSTICGTEWAQKHSLVDGEVPSLEVIQRNLSGFTKNIVLAAKTVEGLIGGFRSRIRNIEKDLWRDFQALEHKLDVRVKQLDRLEHQVHSKQSSGGGGSLSRSSSRAGSESSEVRRLRSENKRLKAEFQQTKGISGQMLSPIPMSPQGAKEGRDLSPSGKPANRASVGSALLRHHSTSAVEHYREVDEFFDHQQHHQTIGTVQTISGYRPAADSRPQSEHREPLQPSEQRWMHRLKLLERQLKAEREARLLDRSGARKRLEEGRQENDELRAKLDKERERRVSLEYELGPET